MSGLLLQVSEALRDLALSASAKRLIVAVSGGADSMALLEALQRAGQEHGWELAVAHLDHQLRGRASEGDARFVADQANRHGLQLFAQKADVRGYARERGLSLEIAGRALRHKVYAQAARRFRAGIVALGHHADDQVELFFLRLFRGSLAEGLMQPISLLPGSRSVRLFRPLLGIPKEEILSFVREHRVEFREDSSNSDFRFLRNRIRGELLPLLRTLYQPALTATVLRVAQITRAEADLARALAERWLASRKRKTFSKLPVAVQRRVLYLQLIARGISPEFRLIEDLRLHPARAVNVPHSVEEAGQRRLVNRAGLLSWVTKAAERASSVAPCPLDLGASGGSEFAGLRFRWKRTRTPPESIRGEPGRECYDAHQVGRRIRLRHWQPGDRFQPIGMPTSVKLQDLFTNLKVPRAERLRRVIAEDEAGEIFWVQGLRISERHKIAVGTKSFLSWHWQPL